MERIESKGSRAEEVRFCGGTLAGATKIDSGEGLRDLGILEIKPPRLIRRMRASR